MWKRLLTLFVVALLFVSIAGAGGAYLWWQNAISQDGPSTEPTRVLIAKGSGVLEIAWQLKRSGVIQYPRLFRLLTDWRELTTSLKAGEYLFPAGVSMEDALARIAQGKTETHFITFAEGLTSHTILTQLAAQEGLTG